MLKSGAAVPTASGPGASWAGAGAGWAIPMAANAATAAHVIRVIVTLLPSIDHGNCSPYSIAGCAGPNGPGVGWPPE